MRQVDSSQLQWSSFSIRLLRIGELLAGIALCAYRKGSLKSAPVCSAIDTAI